MVPVKVGSGSRVRSGVVQMGSDSDGWRQRGEGCGLQYLLLLVQQIAVLPMMAMMREQQTLISAAAAHRQHAQQQQQVSLSMTSHGRSVSQHRRFVCGRCVRLLTRASV
jgi:hypothetical protein